VGQMESAIDVRLPSGAPWKFHIEATDKQTLGSIRRWTPTVKPICASIRLTGIVSALNDGRAKGRKAGAPKSALSSWSGRIAA
jgi:hypothetical protein